MKVVSKEVSFIYINIHIYIYIISYPPIVESWWLSWTNLWKYKNSSPTLTDRDGQDGHFTYAKFFPPHGIHGAPSFCKGLLKGFEILEWSQSTKKQEENS